jgi:hypothetical protein
MPDNFTGKVEYIDGSKTYCVNGELHREGGLPALMWTHGTKEYWVNKKRTGRFFS